MIRTVEVIVAVAMLAVGLVGVDLYVSTQPENVKPKNLAPQAYTVLETLVSEDNLTCDPSQEHSVATALGVLLPPNTPYNFTLYELVGGRVTPLYSVGNAGLGRPQYGVTVELVLNRPVEPGRPGAPLGVPPLCFAVLVLGGG